MTATPILEIDGVEKHFGGLAALGGVHATVDSGKLTAVIGPNGAGKTTLFNVITGILNPSAGSIRFMGKDITNSSVHEISRLGLARTLQIKSVFHGMTVRENLWIAAQSRQGIFRPFTSMKACRVANERADALLEELQLTHLASQEAVNLSYGDVALLEIGIALATEPKLLLLDEPICGMGPAETERTVEKIRELSKRIDIVIIEHDIEVVFDISDDIIVMALGTVLARGTPAEISENADVRAAYLGDDDA
ncbi:MAG: ABC transporter ATP-binding protein [Rhodospirillaceae bacterium]|nr:ABC transporter ATP-binding protein [Magnetovibrio sp.]MAY67334.1 ABC transporter ATP-binding protein [Rhodospirillaceae bacterium]